MEASSLPLGKPPVWARVRAALHPSEWRRVGGMVAVIIGLHVVGFGLLLLVVVPQHFKLGAAGTFAIGTGITAYTLGMRHAFDADHIAAIDNTTRKMMSEGKRPLSVGFFFSLGHSTIVFGLAFLLSIGVRALSGPVQNNGSTLHKATNVIGTTVSGSFLYVIAILNILILVSIVRIFFDMRRGAYNEEDLEEQLELARADEPLLRQADEQDHASRGRCTPSGCCSASASTPRPRSRCWSSPPAPAQPGFRSTRSCACRSCSPRECRCSTRSMARS